MPRRSAVNSLRDYLRFLETSIKEDADAHLIWGWRLRLWHLLSLAFPTDVGFRYDALAYLTVRRVRGEWSTEAITSDHHPIFRGLLKEVPNGVLRKYRLAILGDNAFIRNVTEWRQQLGRWHWDDDIGPLAPSVILRALMAITARVEYPDLPFGRQLHNGLFGEIDINDDAFLSCMDDLRGDHDPYYFDYEYWASYAASVNPDGTHDTARRRKFWLDWIGKDAAKVLGSGREIRALLKASKP